MLLPERFDEPTLKQIAGRLDRLAQRRLREGERSAAVLVPLCHVGEAPSVLFTKRSETVGTHKGQVSFPGGMADAGDPGPEGTALRELEEEIGFARGRVQVLGRSHEVRAITGVRVVPVVGFLGELTTGELVPCEREIDDVFTLTLADLVNPEKRYEQVLGDRGKNPVFDAGPHPVWGLTAWILKEVLHEVFDVDLGGRE